MDQRMYKMSLEPLDMSDSKKAIKDYEGHVNKTQVSTWRDSLGQTIYNFSLNEVKNWNRLKTLNIFKSIIL